MKNAKNDEDEKRKVNLKIKKLQSEVNKLQQLKNEAGLKQEFKELIREIELETDEIKDTEQQREFNKQYEAIRQDGLHAIEKNNIILLSKTNEQLKNLLNNILISNDETWIYWFRSLLKNPNIINNPNTKKYIDKGIEAANSRNMNELKNCVRNLLEFLPRDEQNELETKIAGITR